MKKVPEILTAGGLRVEVLDRGVRAILGPVEVLSVRPGIKARVRQLFEWFKERRITQQELEESVMEGLVNGTELRNLTCAA